MADLGMIHCDVFLCVFYRQSAHIMKDSVTSTHDSQDQFGVGGHGSS